jgi:hypothetical protein
MILILPETLSRLTILSAKTGLVRYSDGAVCRANVNGTIISSFNDFGYFCQLNQIGLWFLAA